MSKHEWETVEEHTATHSSLQEILALEWRAFQFALDGKEQCFLTPASYLDSPRLRSARFLPLDIASTLFWCCFCFLFYFETGFLCVALAVLELAL